jgi:hypothetical protein
MTPGLIVRRDESGWVGVLRCGAWTSDEARTMADAFLARRSIAGEWMGTKGGSRMKVGVMGLRRFDVLYRLERQP